MGRFMVILFLFIASILAKEITLTVQPNSDHLVNAQMYLSPNDNRIYITNKTSIDTSWTPLKGEIQKDGTLKLNQTSSIAIGKNYLYPSDNSSHFASPFSIRDGTLLLYGHNFHAVPSGVDDVYVIGSINAAAGRPDMVEFEVGVDELVYYDPPEYEGTMRLISVNTVPFMHHHHSKHGRTAPVWNAAMALFAFLNYF